jgi:hypothetical protein
LAAIAHLPGGQRHAGVGGRGERRQRIPGWIIDRGKTVAGSLRHLGDFDRLSVPGIFLRSDGAKARVVAKHPENGRQSASHRLHGREHNFGALAAALGAYGPRRENDPELGQQCDPPCREHDLDTALRDGDSQRRDLAPLGARKACFAPPLGRVG